MSKSISPENPLAIATLKMPAYLASYLINGDSSGIEESERIEADEYLKANDLPGPCDCSDESEFCHHVTGWPMAGDFLSFTFLVPAGHPLAD